MPRKLKRYYGRGDLHFVTFSCYRRLPLLKTARARNLFVHALGKIRERYRFLLAGYVVMPDHVHLLISEPAKATPSVVLKALKQRVSRDFRKNKRRSTDAQLRLPFMQSSHAKRRSMCNTDTWGTQGIFPACVRATLPSKALLEFAGLTPRVRWNSGRQ